LKKKATSVPAVLSFGGMTVELQIMGGMPVVMVVEVVVSLSVGDMLNSMDIAILQLMSSKEIDMASSAK
jgi:hypothetical protein